MKNHSTRTIYLTVVLLFALAQSTSGQEKQKQPGHFGGFGYFAMGYQAYNLSAMNNSLAGAGYPKIHNGSVGIGGGGYYLMNNWLIGGEGYGLPGGSAENANYSVSHAGGYGFLNLGYLIWRTPSFYLYPVLGIGGGGITMFIKDKSLTTSSFDDLLENPSREAYLNNGGLLINFSFMANYIFIGEREENSSGGFSIGLKAGYILNANLNDWTFSGEKLTGTPAAGMSGPYLSIVIGGGGSGNKN